MLSPVERSALAPFTIDWTKVEVPKSASGTIPLRSVGASSIHSADRCDELYLTCLLQLRPVVSFVIDRVQCCVPLHFPAQLNDAVIMSPGFTVSVVMTETLGISSYHAK